MKVKKSYTFYTKWCYLFDYLYFEWCNFSVIKCKKRNKSVKMKISQLLKLHQLHHNYTCFYTS